MRLFLNYQKLGRKVVLKNLKFAQMDGKMPQTSLDRLFLTCMVRGIVRLWRTFLRISTTPKASFLFPNFCQIPKNPIE